MEDQDIRHKSLTSFHEYECSVFIFDKDCKRAVSQSSPNISFSINSNDDCGTLKPCDQDSKTPSRRPDEDTLLVNEEDGQTSPSDLSLREKPTLACIVLANFCCHMCFSLIAPFFPKEAESRGVSTTTSGWVFGIFPLVKCIASPLFGKLIPKVGSKNQFMAGCFLLGISTICFGMLDLIGRGESNLTFLVVTFTLRICLAIGSAATSTASFSIAMTVFKNNEATVMGFVEGAIGIGLMVGPAIGGVIYQRFGFMGPFIFVGGFIQLTIPLYWVMMNVPKEISPEVATSNHQRKNLTKRLLSIPTVLIIFVITFIGAIAWIVVDLTLEPHIRIFELSPSMVGLVFLLIGAIYAILSPIAGKFADRMFNSTPLLVFGFSLVVIGLLTLGPSPLLGLDGYRALWLDLVSLVVLGIGIFFSIIPTYNKMLCATSNAGLEQSAALHGLLGGVWYAVYDLGEFTGPVIGGWLVDALDFPWCSTIIAGINLLMVILTMALLICEWKYGSKVSQCIYKPPIVVNIELECK